MKPSCWPKRAPIACGSQRVPKAIVTLSLWRRKSFICDSRADRCIHKSRVLQAKLRELELRSKANARADRALPVRPTGLLSTLQWKCGNFISGVASGSFFHSRSIAPDEAGEQTSNIEVKETLVERCLQLLQFRLAILEVLNTIAFHSTCIS